MLRSDTDPAVRSLLRQALPDLTGASADLHRVARAGGGLAMADWHGPAADAFRLVVRELVETAEELAERAEGIAEEVRHRGLPG